MRRHFLLSLAAAALFAAAAAPAWAQLEQPIKIVFPYSAGGVGDALARLLGQNLSAGLKGALFILTCPRAAPPAR